jgi:hypothetical protein
MRGLHFGFTPHAVISGGWSMKMMIPWRTAQIQLFRLEYSSGRLPKLPTLAGAMLKLP